MKVSVDWMRGLETVRSLGKSLFRGDELSPARNLVLVRLRL
jgi:hypothetical protein